MNIQETFIKAGDTIKAEVDFRDRLISGDTLIAAHMSIAEKISSRTLVSIVEEVDGVSIISQISIFSSSISIIQPIVAPLELDPTATKAKVLLGSVSLAGSLERTETHKLLVSASTACGLSVSQDLYLTVI